MHKCGICNKPVNPGNVLHGPSGDHWDCYAAQKKKKQDQILAMREKMMVAIADKYAPNRKSGIIDDQLLMICDEYLSQLLEASRV